LLWVGIGLVAAISGIAAVSKFDFERYRSDPDRVDRLAVAELATSAPSASAEWFQWRGPNRDGVSLETGLRAEWPAEGPPLLWKKPIGRGFSSFAISAGRLFTMDQEVVGGPASTTDSSEYFECVVCLDMQTGNELWRFRYPNRYDERFGPGPRSTPSIDGDFVYAVGPTGIMHCLRTSTGAKVWRRDLLDEFRGRPMQYGVSFSPLIEGQLVYVAPGGPEANSIAALDKSTGELVWKALDDPASYSSPIATTACGVRQVLFLTNTELVSYAPDGSRPYWRYPWIAQGGFNIATPIAFGNYIFVASGYGKGCALLELSLGPDGSPRVAHVYEHNRMRPFFASPVRRGDYFYGFDQMDLVCMNVRTGTIVWREKSIREFRKASLLAADGHLIIHGESGTLTLVEATPEGYKEKSSFRVSKSRCWTAPALADGRLVIRDDARVYCFDLRQ
jgi:outer membrane protein assembly factor BamB